MRNIRVRVAYDGSAFFGWQRQDGFVSVQQVLEEAIAVLSDEPVTVHGAGRTDSGVHALGQVASFHADVGLEDERLLHALNAHLPDGVVIQRLETCPDDFHASYSARGKRYAYRVVLGRFRPPFLRAYTHWVRESLDLGRMRRAAVQLRGRRDFSALTNAGSPRASNVRHLQAVRIVPRRESFTIIVQGDGFLYNMVRNIAGTLIDVGRGRTDPEQVGQILRSQDRTRAGPTAPAEGLYLLSVLYPEPCLTRAAGPRRAPELLGFGLRNRA